MLLFYYIDINKNNSIIYTITILFNVKTFNWKNKNAIETDQFEWFDPVS